MKKIAILQSNYIPWKGVFDMINMVDTFVFFDDVDFTKRDWRTRNIIKTSNGDLCLSIPVKKTSRGTKINEVNIINDGWQEKHLESIKRAYKKSEFYQNYLPLLENIYLDNKWESLSVLNQFIIKEVANILEIKTQFIDSTQLNVEGTKDDRLIDICKTLNATTYLSGPAAKNYIDINKFKNNNIGLEYIIYDYPRYTQLHGEFNHFVTVLDVLFNCGIQAPNFIFSGKKEIIF